MTSFQPQPVADDLGEGGRVPLAVMDRSHHQGRGARGIEADLRGFEFKPRSAVDRIGQADPAQLATPGGFGPAGLEGGVIGKRQRVVEVALGHGHDDDEVHTLGGTRCTNLARSAAGRRSSSA